MPRPGRPRQNAPREGNGRINRSWLVTQTERAAMDTAVSARQRLFGLDENQAKQGEGGSVIGRLVLNKVLRRDQYDAAKRFLEVRNAYQRSIGAVPDFSQPREGGPPSDEPERAWEAFCINARRSHDSMLRVLRDLMAQERSPAVMAALDTIVVKDAHVENLVGPLRIALNALGRHFGIQVVQTQQVAA